MALRSLVFSAVTVRAYLETERAPDTSAYHAKMLRWLKAHKVTAELEPAERDFVHADIGSLDRSAVADGLWRSEALGVLAWALGHLTLPEHDEEVDQQAVAKSLGFMHGAGVLRHPKVRDRRELVEYAGRARTVHWRLREMTLRQGALDLEKTASKLAFINLTGLKLVGGDLALGGKSIARAKVATVKNALCIAYQRHQAINWLVYGGARYSETDTPT